MLDQVLPLFDLKIDHDLDVMSPGQSLNRLASRLMTGIDDVLDATHPDCVLVHGDSTSAAVSAMAAFHRQIPIGHVEAGLRTGDPAQPFPEEMNRRIIDAMSTWLFAPTATSRNNLQSENLRGKIWVTGNTGIDSAAAMRRKLQEDIDLAVSCAGRYSWVDRSRKLIVVTGHRRENLGAGLRSICAALAILARRPDVQIVYALHLNPNARESIMDHLGGLANVHLVEPLNYPAFIWFMQQAQLIMTDSGGVQEEAAFLGKPVLVMRDVTERPEAVDAGAVLMVGTDRQRIIAQVEQLLDDACLCASFANRPSLYGDGHACERIVAALCGRPVIEFDSPPRRLEMPISPLR